MYIAHECSHAAPPNYDLTEHSQIIIKILFANYKKKPGHLRSAPPNLIHMPDFIIFVIKGGSMYVQIPFQPSLIIGITKCCSCSKHWKEKVSNRFSLHLLRTIYRCNPNGYNVKFFKLQHRKRVRKVVQQRNIKRNFSSIS